MTTLTSAGIEDRFNSDSKHLIALDVDGTLVDHDGHMSPNVRSAAKDAIGAGHHLVVSTGRSFGAALPVLENIGLTEGFTVCSNGGVTLHVDTSLPDGYEIVDRVVFDPRPALDALRVELPTAKFALEDHEGRFLSTERFQDASFGAEAKAVDFEFLRECRAVRVVVFSTDSTAEEFGQAVESIGLHGVTYSVGWTAWLDIAAAGVTKASALEQVRRRLDIDPMHTVAVGDGRNDIEMLSWAARGVAMGQSPGEVVAAASEVTGSVYEDGAAAVLRSLIAAR
ncbi:HAD family phosphatase [Arthrobacter sp. BL-252-APC-1A]|uniref:HAD family hydrolase n=1 Tax=Arthrobacter sp. BL-252-APC-1A TaxID=2606622 RepID=UPI0012B1F42E|nr:HAD family hydrolase [Arthrobacter sp. BL-252-APC-1A]MSR99072.1 HAD family phosphatase [Arthrobacter sp. BL-252-APC-1A]